MRVLLFIFLSICLFSACKENLKQKEKKTAISKKDTASYSFQNYTNTHYNFKLQFPETYNVLESELAGGVPVINIYQASRQFNPPFAIHEKAENNYIAFLPNGFGVDSPNGKQLSVAKWKKTIPVNFQLNENESTVYLLENNQVWAYSLIPKEKPKTWQNYGSIFVHFQTENFKSWCEDEEGKKIATMKNCDPIAGDLVKYSGKINSASKKALIEVLRSIQFITDDQEKEKVTGLFKLEKPLPNIEVKSPLQIEGKAKGFWFFEGISSVKLVDKDGKILAEGNIKATEDWMTEDFVNFKGSLEFIAPNDERGYLIFSRANPSGLPENKMEYKSPVLFPPK